MEHNLRLDMKMASRVTVNAVVVRNVRELREALRQHEILDFVLSHYVSVGVDELEQEKLTPLLRLRYHNSIADAVADLGKPEEIGQIFSGFQKFLYQSAVNAAPGV
jgi:hypothetical protein